MILNLPNYSNGQKITTGGVTIRTHSNHNSHHQLATLSTGHKD
jgi:hypothetical protein